MASQKEASKCPTYILGSRATVDFRRLSRLTKLVVDHASSIKPAHHIEALVQLTHLDMDMCWASRRPTASKTRFPWLAELFRRATSITNLALTINDQVVAHDIRDSVHLLTNLETMVLTATSVYRPFDWAAWCQQLPTRLNTLIIDTSAFIGTRLQQVCLAHLQNLRSLHIQHMQVSLAVLGEIVCLPNLTSLSICIHRNDAEAQVMALSQFTSLKRLFIRQVTGQTWDIYRPHCLLAHLDKLTFEPTKATRTQFEWCVRRCATQPHRHRNCHRQALVDLEKMRERSDDEWTAEAVRRFPNTIHPLWYMIGRPAF